MISIHRQKATQTLRAAMTILRLSFRVAPRQAILVTSLTIAVALCGAIQPLWLGLLVTAIIDMDERAALLVAAAIGLTATAFVVLDWVRFQAAQSLQERTSLYLDERMASMSMEIPGVEHHERVEFQDRLAVLREQRIFLGQSLMSTLGGINLTVRAIAVLGLLAAVSPVLLLLPLFGIGLVICTKKADQLREQSLSNTAACTRQAQQFFDLVTSARSAKELHIFRLKNELLHRHDALSQMIDSERKSAMLRGAGSQAIGWIAFVAGYTVAISYIAMLALRNDVSPGELAMTLGLATQVYGLLQGGLAMVAWMLLGLGAVTHYLWLADYAEAAMSRNAPVLPGAVPARLTSGIEFRDVSFRYPGTDSDILSEVNLTLPAGATVAIVGDNGAGKSTLVKLLCRFYDPVAGKIIVDGVELGTFALDDWRSRLAAAFQDFARFEFVARESVGVGDLCRLSNDEAVMGALEQAGAVSLVRSLPVGLETQLGKRWEGGVDLSGGQWQKVALGRAMMRQDPLVLILDEPTASLDPQAEHELFQRQIHAARRTGAEHGTITIFVSHRFSTVRMADMIVVLDGGRIREVGSHAELQAAGGLYAELFELQARTYR
ncbi:MAG: ABC transporter ATP-binding protein [Thermomicrobiales bacterium]